MPGPVFILATEIEPGSKSWARAEEQAAGLAAFASRLLGFAARVTLAALPAQSLGEENLLAQSIEREIAHGATGLFILPVGFEFNVWQRMLLGQTLSEARRLHPGVPMHHDDIDPAHPLLVDCLVDQILNAFSNLGIAPKQAGVLLVASGQGDPRNRADSYRLMRLLWEQAGFAFGAVGFVRHDQPFLAAALEQCAREGLHWILVPQSQWGGEVCDRAQLILADHQRTNSAAGTWRLVDPPGDHPAITGWLEDRLRSLWQEKRARQAARVTSHIHDPAPLAAEVWTDGRWTPADVTTPQPRAGILGRARGANSLAEILSRVLPPAERYLIKVTWHGYATGTYTDPVALDLLLSALPGRAILLEGHTSSRNLGGADWDWETEAKEHRTWIREQDLEFLRRTGLAEVIARHNGQYLNVTEAWWDGACAPEEQVHSALGEVTLRHPELASFVPAVLLEHRGLPLLSFARFKGPTRLSISNFFGLIPHPLRTAWHGPNITHFASVCCDIARLYGGLFRVFGLVEAFVSAVRWNRHGLYRSRWGNYDLVAGDGIFTLSEGPAAADLLASRLQGQDVRRSAFYDVVRERLGWSEEAAAMPLPVDIQATLV